MAQRQINQVRRANTLKLYTNSLWTELFTDSSGIW